MNLRVAVVVLNYNTRDLLRNCLRSVFAAAHEHDDQISVDVVVVDSASHDESAAMVAAEFPQATLIASRENIGYTGGNNLALHQLGFEVDAPAWSGEPLPSLPTPDYVLLLNADTELATDAIWQLATTLTLNSQVGACGANLRYGDGSFQHGAFAFPSLPQLLLDLIPAPTLRGLRTLWAKLYASSLNGRYPRERWEENQPFVVDFVLGAAIMVRGAAIQAVGGLDRNYFLYCEEIDWCLRLRMAGWQTMAVPTAHVTHYEGQSSRQVRWPSYERLWRSRLRFYQKHQSLYPFGYLQLVRWLVQAGLRWRSYVARRRFAQGQLTGSELGAELATYNTLIQTFQHGLTSH